MTRRRGMVAALAVMLAMTVGSALAGDRWLHVRVLDSGDADGAEVRVNVPLSVVEAVLPTIASEQLAAGKVRWDGDEDLDAAKLREILTALADSPDGEFVTVRDGGESVRVAKERGFLLVHADDDGERVRVRLPLDVVDAMLAGGGTELDLAAGLRALSRYDGQDLVTVDSDDSRVRIWIDGNQDGD